MRRFTETQRYTLWAYLSACKDCNFIFWIRPLTLGLTWAIRVAGLVAT
jgi:hypothetical protein